MREGDFVLIKQNSPGQIIEGSGVILEVFDMPNTFGRKMISAFVNGHEKTYDDAFYLFKVLSRGALKRPKL
jgi:hypothetical protein|tara:strand:- start:77 stop:289 length:213 start_codon:yes stop_codon:yes gene_type:complete